MPETTGQASADAGERWYQLVQTEADLKLIARSLNARAQQLRTEARGRKFSGPQCAVARKMLRTEADECVAIAARAWNMAEGK